jgi:RNA polymerase sigma-B factor
MTTTKGRGAVDVNELFLQYQKTPTRALRNTLVEQHLALANHVARRFRYRGVPADDLRQVALLAVVKAVDRFDPERGVAFSTFAGRTIEGEIKRHFRDTTWAVRVPRPVQELHLAVRNAADDLRHELGRAPTPADIAHHLEIGIDDVIGALAAGAAYTPSSLDMRSTNDDGTSPDRAAELSVRDETVDATPERVAIRQLLASLPERERRIVWLRFFGQMTQSQIAAEVGISQMHVSRLLKQSLELMRERAGS